MIDGQSVSYCPLEDKFKEYRQDCWTYDGRLVENLDIHLIMIEHLC